MYVYYSGTANSTTVNSGGWLFVYNGGTANYTTVNSGGYLYVSRGGTVNDTTLNNADLYLYDGGTANGTTVNWNMYVSGGTAAGITVNEGGNLDVQGGTLKNTEVRSGGYVNVNGGKLTGSLTIAEEGYISIDDGIEFDFDLTERSAQNETLINDLSLIEGAPVYTITVSADQANGTYTLAGGASEFTGTLSLGTDGANYGTVTVNGDALIYGDHTYTLATSDDSLLLTVEGETPTPPPTPPAPTFTTEFFTGHFIGTGNALKDVVLYGVSEGGKVNVVSKIGTGFMSFELGAAGDPWKLIGIGDFNGDGVSDVLWRNMSIGDVGSWLGDGSFGVTWQHMAGVAVGEWEIVGVGDFDSDGRSDVLWAHDGGAIGAWITATDRIAVGSWLPIA